MKATGIVRRIDDLGRVVIPKEIRRTMRIREGDPLEIFTNSEGEVIFKKYSPIGEMSRFAAQYCEVLHRTSGFPAAVCDRDHVIAASGMPKRELLDQHISPEIETLMDARRTYQRKRGDEEQMTVCAQCDRRVDIAVPIISSGDITGCVILFDDGAGGRAGESELKLMQAAAQFLGKQTEE